LTFDLKILHHSPVQAVTFYGAVWGMWRADRQTDVRNATLNAASYPWRAE